MFTYFATQPQVRIHQENIVCQRYFKDYPYSDNIDLLRTELKWNIRKMTTSNFSFLGKLPSPESFHPSSLASKVWNTTPTPDFKTALLGIEEVLENETLSKDIVQECKKIVQSINVHQIGFHEMESEILRDQRRFFGAVELTGYGILYGILKSYKTIKRRG
jgi:hypothetical protein